MRLGVRILGFEVVRVVRDGYLMRRRRGLESN